jgi:hypothetical protein
VDYRESNDFWGSKLMVKDDYTIRAVDSELWDTIQAENEPQSTDIVDQLRDATIAILNARGDARAAAQTLTRVECGGLRSGNCPTFC